MHHNRCDYGMLYISYAMVERIGGFNHPKCNTNLFKPAKTFAWCRYGVQGWISGFKHKKMQHELVITSQNRSNGVDMVWNRIVQWWISGFKHQKCSMSFFKLKKKRLRSVDLAWHHIVQWWNSGFKRPKWVQAYSDQPKRLHGVNLVWNRIVLW